MAADAVRDQPCNAWDSRQKFFVATGAGSDAYPRWSGGSYNNVSRAKLVVYFDLYSKCVNPGTSPSNGQALTVGGCPRFGDQPGNLEYRPAPDYTSSHFRPVAGRNRAIDLSLGGGGHTDGGKIQYDTADTAKSNQQWYLVPDMPFDAPHGWLEPR
jgi:hypothetical protein